MSIAHRAPNPFPFHTTVSQNSNSRIVINCFDRLGMWKWRLRYRKQEWWETKCMWAQCLWEPQRDLLNWLCLLPFLSISGIYIISWFSLNPTHLLFLRFHIFPLLLSSSFIFKITLLLPWLSSRKFVSINSILICLMIYDFSPQPNLDVDIHHS